MHRVLGKLSNASLARACSRWRKAASRNSRLRSKVESVLFRLRWRVCAAGMNTWVVVTKMRLRGRMVVQRMQQWQAHKAFQTWCDEASKISRNRRVLSKMLHRMVKRLLLLVWSMFVDTVREMQHNRESVRRALLRMKQSQLAGAFDCYAGAVNTLVAQRERVARTMAKWKSPSLKRAMEAWTEYLEMMHGEQAQDAQALAKQQLEAAAKEHRSRAEAEAERRIEMCRRVVQRMLQQQLLMAWSMFVDTVREMQHNRESVRRALLRMKQSQLAGAFDCYAGAVNTLVEQRERVARTIARLRRRTAILAMKLWFTNFIAALEERVEQDRRNVLMRSLISRILQAALARVCSRWFEYVSQVSGYLKLIFVYTRVRARARVYTRARTHTHTGSGILEATHTHTHTHTHM